ncbi:FkbM family methyltransferase [Anabaena sp. FACHB-709]|uniref:FkbM family methyltransferase n=1 Tax=Nostocaceae TaxID=1162 RepID=UPI0037BE219E
MDVDFNNDMKSNINIIKIPVYLERLEKVLGDKYKLINILKIDVEGHELQVLQGAGNFISHQTIRDILFEEHHGYPSQLTEFLEKNGYRIFRIWKGFWKPILLSPTKTLIHEWEPPNYLATLDPKRAIKLFDEWGWKSLSGRIDN